MSTKFLRQSTSKIERIPVNALSRVAISALIIATMWLGIYIPTAEFESAQTGAESALQLGASIKRVLALNCAFSAGVHSSMNPGAFAPGSI